MYISDGRRFGIIRPRMRQERVKELTACGWQWQQPTITSSLRIQCTSVQHCHLQQPPHHLSSSHFSPSPSLFRPFLHPGPRRRVFTVYSSMSYVLGTTSRGVRTPDCGDPSPQRYRRAAATASTRWFTSAAIPVRRTQYDRPS